MPANGSRTSLESYADTPAPVPHPYPCPVDSLPDCHSPAITTPHLAHLWDQKHDSLYKAPSGDRLSARLPIVPCMTCSHLLADSSFVSASSAAFILWLYLKSTIHLPICPRSITYIVSCLVRSYITSKPHPYTSIYVFISIHITRTYYTYASHITQHKPTTSPIR